MQQHAKATDRDGSFERDVLRLEDGQTESAMDETLKGQAREVGAVVDAQAAQRQQTPPKSISSDLARKSTESVGSKTSQSIGFMSTFSDASRDQHHLQGNGRSRVSLSYRDHEALATRGLPDGMQSMSFSPPTTPSHSILSLPLSSPESSPKKHFMRIRGLSMLRLHRTDSSASLNDHCPHCPHHALTQRRAVHKLPCGHKLCTQALRNTLQSASESKAGAIPTCCGVPIPGKLVDHVAVQTAQCAVLDKSEQSDGESSRAASVFSEPRPSQISQRSGNLSMGSQTTSDELGTDSVAPTPQDDLSRAMEAPGFQRLCCEQAELRDRSLAWIAAQRAALETQHDILRSTLKARHETATDELLERHNAAMSEAEDKQVKAEGDMRGCHEQEKRDNATALKHMEAYCGGTVHSTGEPHSRIVTDQDRAELEKARRKRDQMDAKHDSAINVLRGEQGRRMRLRAQRQEKEVQELSRQQRKDELELERSCTLEAHELDNNVAEKRVRMRSRWQLQTAIFVRKFELETGVAVNGKLPSVEWQAEKMQLLQGANQNDEERREMEAKRAGISTKFAMTG